MPITAGSHSGYEAYCRQCKWSKTTGNHDEAERLLKEHRAATGHTDRPGDPKAQDAELTKHVNLLRKAGRQTETPVSVLVNAGEINRKSGDVRITFVTREKITRERNAESNAA